MISNSEPVSRVSSPGIASRGASPESGAGTSGQTVSLNCSGNAGNATNDGTSISVTITKTGETTVSVTGTTVGEVLKNLEKACPGIGARLLDDKGGVKRYVNIFHNDEDIRFLKELDTPVADSDKISIIPAIAGGC